MMTIVNSLDRLTAWAEKNICSEITLKKPNNQESGERYQLELVHPAAFTMFTPLPDRLPQNTATAPSLCVQLAEGQNRLTDSVNAMKIVFSLSCWNPGEHQGEILLPDGSEKKDVPFARTMNGWRDMWNFVDVTMYKLRNTLNLDGLLLDRHEGIHYGQYLLDGTVIDYYPYFHAWVSFTMETGATAVTPEFNKFL